MVTLEVHEIRDYQRIVSGSVSITPEHSNNQSDTTCFVADISSLTIEEGAVVVRESFLYRFKNFILRAESVYLRQLAVEFLHMRFGANLSRHPRELVFLRSAW